MKTILTMAFALQCLTLSAQTEFPNTLTLPEGSASPKASLKNIEWLAGRWVGEAFGGTTEELWSPPDGKSMMSVFRSVVNGKVNFYEIVTIVEENETLVLRLKHFHADLKGWEEKNVTQDFRLVKMTPDRIYFEGFTFEKVSANQMNSYVVIGSRKETLKELSFPYTRANLN
ncbi:MAG: DUF6265 family protein [Cyclobacteriaceae bacterium]|nr:hypothetical protein [Cyclobacteriaceae bacterium]